jgi:hypothetical protein
MILKTGGHMTDTNIIKFPPEKMGHKNENENDNSSFGETDVFFSSEKAKFMGVECAIVFQKIYEGHVEAVTKFGEDYLSSHPNASNHELGKQYINTPSVWYDVSYSEFGKFFPYWHLSKVISLTRTLVEKQYIIQESHPDNGYAKRNRFFFRLFIWNESTELGSPYLNWDENDCLYDTKKYQKYIKNKDRFISVDKARERMQSVMDKLYINYFENLKAIQNVLMNFGFDLEWAKSLTKDTNLYHFYTIFKFLHDEANERGVGGNWGKEFQYICDYFHELSNEEELLNIQRNQNENINKHD